MTPHHVYGVYYLDLPSSEKLADRMSLEALAAITDIALKRPFGSRGFHPIYELLEVFEEGLKDSASRSDLHGYQLRALFHRRNWRRRVGAFLAG